MSIKKPTNLIVGNIIMRAIIIYFYFTIFII
nr:MAG TPA: hypothetical protein [Caudoviricetes sp.]